MIPAAGADPLKRIEWYKQAVPEKKGSARTGTACRPGFFLLLWRPDFGFFCISERKKCGIYKNTRDRAGRIE